MKTHYDWVSKKKNETEYTRTICGLKDKMLLLETTLQIKKVNCENCLRLLKCK